MQACRSSEWAIVAEALMNNAGYGDPPIPARYCAPKLPVLLSRVPGEPRTGQCAQLIRSVSRSQGDSDALAAKDASADT